MNKKILIKMLVIGTIVLFFGASIVQGFAIEQNQTYEKLDVYSFTPTDDNYLDEWQPEKIRGSGESIRTRNTGAAGYAYDSIIRFDISSLPPDISIVSATLKIYYYKWYDNNPSGRLNKLYRITSDWDELTSCWNNQPSYASTPTDTTSVPSSTGMWMEFDVLDDILDFIDGTYQNYGWRIKDENYFGGMNIPTAYFYSKDYGSFMPTLEIISNDPPLEPMISGEVNGKYGEPYDYTFTTFDPDENQIYLWVEWGDGTTPNWIGPFDSGEQVLFTHTWSGKGTYKIKAKAKDTYDLESDWAELTVKMPYNNQFWRLYSLLDRFPILQGLLEEKYLGKLAEMISIFF